MKKGSAKTSNREGSKKTKTGSTKEKKSRTKSSTTTYQTLWSVNAALNSKDIWTSQLGENWNLSCYTTPDSICEFYFNAITGSDPAVEYGIRIGPKGLEFRGPSEKRYRTIG
jgi:hypothetical protein